MSTYVVEKNEGTSWVSKMRCNFDDKDNFKVIARNQFYRILKDGKDVTASYRTNKKISESTLNSEIKDAEKSASSEIKKSDTPKVENSREPKKATLQKRNLLGGVKK